jgi:hypothetical protein
LTPSSKDPTEGEIRFRKAFSRLRPTPPPPMEIKPCSPFEIMIAERLQALRTDLDRLETRLWWLFALIVGAAVANIVIGLLP